MQNMQTSKEENPIKRILIIKLSALGDFIQALGPMKAIRKHHPEAHITLLTTKPFIDLANASGYFNAIQIDPRPKWNQLPKWISLRNQLNAGQYDRVYDLQNNDRTGFYFKLFKQKPEWVGIAPGASHRNTSPQRTAGLAFEGHVQTLGLAGIKNINIDKLDWIEADTSQFNLQNPYILIIPGSAANRPEKRWPVSNYIILCQMLVDKGYQPVILGTDAEKDITQKITDETPNALNLTGQTSLFQIAILARNAKGAIGNDTGPMHVIAPTGCPTLTLFSQHSNPKRHAPKGEKADFVQVENWENLEPEQVFTKMNEITAL